MQLASRLNIAPVCVPLHLLARPVDKALVSLQARLDERRDQARDGEEALSHRRLLGASSESMQSRTAYCPDTLHGFGTSCSLARLSQRLEGAYQGLVF